MLKSQQQTYWPVQKGLATGHSVHASGLTTALTMAGAAPSGRVPGSASRGHAALAAVEKALAHAAGSVPASQLFAKHLMQQQLVPCQLLVKLTTMSCSSCLKHLHQIVPTVIGLLALTLPWAS